MTTVTALVLVSTGDFGAGSVHGCRPTEIPVRLQSCSLLQQATDDLSQGIA